MTANVGIAERADRLLAVLLATFLVGVGVSVVLLIVVLALLSVASLVTVVQRMLAVRRQVLARAPDQHTPACRRREPVVTTSRAAGLRGVVPGGLLGLVGDVSGRAATTGQTLGLRAGFAAVRALPAPAAYRLFDLIADVSARRGGKGVDRLRSNYARVRPELGERDLDALVRAGMRSYMRYYCDAFRLVGLDAGGSWPRRCAVVGDEAGTAALVRRVGGAVVVPRTPRQLGQPEARGPRTHLAPVTTVAERLEPEEVFRDFLEFRESLGMTIIPLTGAGDPFIALKQAVARGDFVALLADRDLTHNGVEVDLCGHRARMAKGAAVLVGDDQGAAVRRDPLVRGRARAALGKRVVIDLKPVRDARDVGLDPRQGPGRWCRRAPTSSATRSPGTPRTGTCCSGCSSTTSTTGSHRPSRPHRRPALVRIGIVCPYSFDIPGGVQYHVRDLAEVFLAQGHHVSVLAPAVERTRPARLHGLGRPRGARCASTAPPPGSTSARWPRRGCRSGSSPASSTSSTCTSRSRPSVAVLALWAAEGPIVATFHTSTLRSRTYQAAYPIVRPSLEKITARIAVSEDARRTVTTHLGGDAVVIPNGVFVHRFDRARAADPTGRAHPSARRSRSSAGWRNRARVCQCSPPRCRQVLARDAGPPGARRRSRRPPRGDRRPAARGGRGVRVPRPGERRGQGAAAEVGRPLRRPQHRRRELRDHPHRGDERGRAGAGERPAGVRPRPRRRSGRRHLRQRGPARTSAAAWSSCWPTRPDGSSWRRAAGGGPTSSTGRWSPSDVMAVYETVTDGAARVRPAADSTSRWTRLLRSGRPPLG